jgi:hypothetical protein
MQSSDDRREERSRAVQRRRLVALLAVALLLAGGAAGAVVATRGTSGTTAPTPATTQAAERVAVTTATTFAATSREEQALASPSSATVTIAAVGDIVMGTPTYGLPSDGGRSFFDGVDQELVSRDVVIGNLEGTLTNGGSSKCGPGSTDCYAFRTPPPYARWLARAGFTIMNLANNHAYDYGAEGQRQTLAALERVGLRWTGRPGQITTQQVGPVTVAVLGFAPYPWAQSLLALDAARRLVRTADRKADVVIVTFHGGAEGSSHTHVPQGGEVFLGENRGDERAFAHAVVDAGADLVVGHGPHVLRGMEWYQDRLIAYSMGNFGGYKVFSLGGVLSVSGILHVTLHGDGTWAKGELVATELAGEGVPAIDPAEVAHGVVRQLSREDFGGSAIRVSPVGALRAPASG